MKWNPNHEADKSPYFCVTCIDAGKPCHWLNWGSLQSFHHRLLWLEREKEVIEIGKYGSRVLLTTSASRFTMMSPHHMHGIGAIRKPVTTGSSPCQTDTALPVVFQPKWDKWQIVGVVVSNSDSSRAAHEMYSFRISATANDSAHPNSRSLLVNELTDQGQMMYQSQTWWETQLHRCSNHRLVSNSSDELPTTEQL